MSLRHNYRYKLNQRVKPSHKGRKLGLVSIVLLSVSYTILVYTQLIPTHSNQPNFSGNTTPPATSVSAPQSNQAMNSMSSRAGIKSQNNQPPTLPNLTFSHLGIITTTFWVGESADSDNGYIANTASAWDEQWQNHYGGVDSPTNRQGFWPATFTPRENPFYIALPYSDFTADGTRKPSANGCPNSQDLAVKDYSWCKNTWVGVRCGQHIAYGQWEDSGPFEDDDTAYVFGQAAPKNRQDAKAGLDVSPALHDYLKLSDVSRCDWTFVPVSQVPTGPWQQIITISKGTAISN